MKYLGFKMMGFLAVMYVLLIMHVTLLKMNLSPYPEIEGPASIFAFFSIAICFGWKWFRLEKRN